MPNKIIINDVGPRDGLQNQSKILTAEQRIQLIKQLALAGIPRIEIGSFVSPKAVPAMAGTDLVAAGLAANGASYSALIPNKKGYELARAAGLKSMALVIAASDTMNEKNIGMSTEQAMTVSKQVIAQGREDGIEMLAYVATAWECPFEGLVGAATVSDLVARLLAAGAAEIVLADTIGAANPLAVKSLLKHLIADFAVEGLSCHFHDTRAMALANIYAATEIGITKFDAAIGGLGGCPFSPGASGNVATEDVVLMFEQMGYDTGIDLKKLLLAVDLVAQYTGNCPGGKSLHWLRRQAEKE